MNIFNKIGNSIEKRKKEKDLRIDKYWKLSATERMDYDNKLGRINKDSEIDMFSFPLTGLVIKVFLFFTLIFSLIAFGLQTPIRELINSLIPLSLEIVKILIFALLFDFVINLFTVVSDKSNKKIKELNKRFKLI